MYLLLSIGIHFYKEAKYYLPATLPDLSITITTPITTSSMGVINVGLDQDHTGWIYVFQEVCPEDKASDGNVSIVLRSRVKLPSPLILRWRLWPVLPITYMIHIHISATKLRTTILKHAGSSRETLTQLLTRLASNAPIEVCAELCNPETIKRSLVLEDGLAEATYLSTFNLERPRYHRGWRL